MLKNIYDFTVTTISGEEISMQEFKDKVILIVNTASRCGFTKQYTELENLHQQFAEKGLVILGFPCNQFANQEPGSDSQIINFCQVNFGVSFRLMKKVDVNGSNADPLFSYLKESAPGIFGSKSIKWNFTKFLISRNGNNIVRFAPHISPRKLTNGIQSLL
jgi:glutathione peroxidase